MTPEERAQALYHSYLEGMPDVISKPTYFGLFVKDIAGEIREAILEEREACAVVADGYYWLACSAKIRARGRR